MLHVQYIQAMSVGSMCEGAVKPSRFKMVGPTFASPGSLTVVLNLVPSGRPGPPMMTGTCRNSLFITPRMYTANAGQTSTPLHSGQCKLQGLASIVNSPSRGCHPGTASLLMEEVANFAQPHACLPGIGPLAITTCASHIIVIRVSTREILLMGASVWALTGERVCEVRGMGLPSSSMTGLPFLSLDTMPSALPWSAVTSHRPPSLFVASVRACSSAQVSWSRAYALCFCQTVTIQWSLSTFSHAASSEGCMAVCQSFLVGELGCVEEDSWPA